MYSTFFWLRKTSLLLAFFLLFSLFVPIISHAATAAKLYYDPDTDALFGGVYAQDPNQVTLEVYDENNNYQVINPSNFFTSDLYDDNNQPYYNIIFDTDSDGINRMFINDGGDRLELEYQGSEPLLGDIWTGTQGIRLDVYRMEANEYISEFYAEEYMSAPNTLFSFEPTQSNSDVLEFAFPYAFVNGDTVPSSNINYGELDASDFYLKDKTVNEYVYFDQYNEVSSYDVIQFKLQEKLQENHRYTLYLSDTSEENEIQLPEAGTYSMYVRIGTEPDFQTDGTYNRISADNTHYFDNFTFSVNPDRNSGGNSGDDDSDNDSNGGGGGGSGGTASDDDETIDETENGVRLGNGAANVEHTETEDGQKETRVTLDGEKLGEAFGLLRENNSRNVTIQVEDVEDSLTVSLPGEEIHEADDLNDTVIEIESEIASYSLPISILQPERYAEELGTDVENLQFNVHVQKASDSVTNEIKESAQGKLVTDPIEFKIVVKGNGKEKEIKQFGQTYVKRTLYIDSEANSNDWVAVVYDPDHQAFKFVPATFTTKNGKTEVSILRPGNSIYTIIESEKSFADLNGHWGKEDIELLASKLIISGMTDETFVPDAEVTRSQFAAMLVRSLALDDAPNAATEFEDVDREDWFAGALGAAVQAGIVQGNDQKLRPNDTITRAEMAVMLARALEFIQTENASANGDNSDLSAFKDFTSIPDWAKDAAEKAVSAGLINGMEDGTFAPNQTGTRAQAAVMIKRLLEYVEFL